jgi:hypothetical protein
MTVEWADYQVFDPRVCVPWRELPRKQAREIFNRVMSEKPDRIRQLKRLLHRHNVDLLGTDEGIDALEQWFITEVQPDSDRPDRLVNWWYGVAFDIGLFIGDTLIERAPNLHWELFTGGRTFPYYQNPVIAGFVNSPVPRLRVDPPAKVASLGECVIAGQPPRAHEWLPMIHDLVREA